MCRGWQEEELKDTCLLVFANKQDMANAMTPTEISEGLGLTALKGRQWQIFKTSAIKGEGLTEGLDWYGRPWPVRAAAAVADRRQRSAPGLAALGRTSRGAGW